MKIKLTDKQVRDYMSEYDEKDYHSAMIALEKQYLSKQKEKVKKKKDPKE